MGDLFEEKKSNKLKAQLNRNVKGILRKSKLNVLSTKGLPFDASELEILRPLIITLGLDVDDVDDSIRRINYYFTTLEEFNKANVVANLAAIKELLEKYHKFRVQLNNGKPKTLLPISFKQAQSEPVISTPISQPHVSPIVPSMPNINVPKPPATISPVPDANKFNPKRKRVPCVHYHSPMGCARGDRCDFIHDPNYEGMPTPNMDKYVRPMNRLSKNPDINIKNVQKLSHRDPHTGHAVGYGNIRQQGYAQNIQQPSYTSNIQANGFNNTPRANYGMMPPQHNYGNPNYSGMGPLVPPPPRMPSYMHSNLDPNTEMRLGKRQDYREQGYQDGNR